jgi:hypothetical protein
MMVPVGRTANGSNVVHFRPIVLKKAGCGGDGWADSSPRDMVYRRMMGVRTVMQEALICSFSLEQHVPVDHLLRSIDRFVDLSIVRAHLRPY